MKINNKICRYSNIQTFYGIVLFLMYANYFLDISEVFQVDSIIMVLLEVLIAILFVAKIITQRYNKKSLLITATCGCIALFISIMTGEKFLMLIYLVLFSAQGTNLRKNIKISFCTKTFFLLLTFLIFIINQITSGGNFLSDGFMASRFSMGIAHPNFTFFLYFWTMIELFYLKFEKIEWRYIIAIILVLAIALIFTKSKTGLVMSILFATLASVILLKRKRVEKALLAVAKFVLPFTAFAMIVLVLLFGRFNMENAWFIWLDKVLSRRISLSWIGLQEYGVAILPQHVNSSEIVGFFAPGYSYYMPLVVDIFYIKSLISYTLIPLVGFSYLIYEKIKIQKSGVVAMIVILFAIYALSEAHGFNACATPMFLILGSELFSLWQYRKKDYEYNG